MTSWRYRKLLNVAQANDRPMQRFPVLPKTRFDTNMLRPITLVVNKPLLAQVQSAIPRVEESSFQRLLVGAQLRHQRDELALVNNFFKRTYEIRAHVSRMRLNSEIPSFSRRFPSCKLTSEGSHSLLDAGTYKKRLPGRHYRRSTCIDFRDVEKNISLHAVQWPISNLATSPTRGCQRNTYGSAICRNLFKQVGKVSEKSEPVLHGKRSMRETSH